MTGPTAARIRLRLRERNGQGPRKWRRLRNAGTNAQHIILIRRFIEWSIHWPQDIIYEVCFNIALVSGFIAD